MKSNRFGRSSSTLVAITLLLTLLLALIAPITAQVSLADDAADNMASDSDSTTMIAPTTGGFNSQDRRRRIELRGGGGGGGFQGISVGPGQGTGSVATTTGTGGLLGNGGAEFGNFGGGAGLGNTGFIGRRMLRSLSSATNKLSHTFTSARRSLQQQGPDLTATDNIDAGSGGDGTPNPFRISSFGGGIGGTRFGGAGAGGGFQTRTGVAGGRRLRRV